MPITRNTIASDLKRKSSKLDTVPNQAHKYFKDITPKRSGNAQKRTRLSNNAIKANYDYATNLDKGSSKKAPQGMSKPTSKYITALVKQIMRK